MTRSEPPAAGVWLPLLREALAREGRFRLPLRGNSMLPTLPAECEIDVEPLDREPRPGELVVFAVGDALVAHRVVRRADEFWIAQGDNRRVADPALRREQILGVVRAARVGEKAVWPGRWEAARVAWWLTRAELWRAARWTWRKAPPAIRSRRLP